MDLLTVVKCYGFLWAANPCRLVYAHWDRKLPRELVSFFFILFLFRLVSSRPLERARLACRSSRLFMLRSLEARELPCKNGTAF